MSTKPWQGKHARAKSFRLRAGAGQTLLSRRVIEAMKVN